MLYEGLKKAAWKEIEERIERLKGHAYQRVEEGKIDAWEPKRWLTPLRIDQLKSGDLSKEKALSIIAKKAEKIKAKESADLDRKLKAVAGAGDLPDQMTLVIDWYRGDLAAMQAKATIYGFCDGPREGKRTGGWGYDKESTATGDLFDKCPEILKKLYDFKELKGPEKKNCVVFGYGSGYGALPYFEGGVGFTCHIAIWQRLGYKVEHVQSTKSRDAYTITKG